MRIVVSFLVEQAKTLPLPFLAKEGKTTSVAIFCTLVSVPPVRLTVKPGIPQFRPEFRSQ